MENRKDPDDQLLIQLEVPGCCLIEQGRVAHYQRERVAVAAPNEAHEPVFFVSPTGSSYQSPKDAGVS